MRQYWRASNLLNPVPIVLVSCEDDQGHANIMTAGWTGTICSDPVMVSVSIRKSRYSHDIIANSGEFVINMANTKMALATDYCGIYSGRNVDKFNLPGAYHLTKQESKMVKAPSIQESPITLECKVKQILELGTHDMFIAEVVATGVNDECLDAKGSLDMKKADLMCYEHGEYHAVGRLLGTFGYSSKKPEKQRRKKQGERIQKKKISSKKKK